MANNEKTTSATPSIDKLNRMLGTSPAPRMLTAYEDELLRRSAHEIVAVATKIMRQKDNAGNSSNQVNTKDVDHGSLES